MNIFGDEGLKAEIKSLKSDILFFRRKIASLEDEIAKNDIVNSELQTRQSILLATRDNDMLVLKETMNDKISKEVSQTKKDYKSKTESLEREHANKMKSLEKEYVEKLARVDRKLEEDKTSFKKYFKTEFNGKIENLEKENDRLFKENVTLKAENSAVTGSKDSLQGQIESLTSIMEQIVNSLPVVSATMTTPETHVHVEPAKGGQGGGNKQEQKN